MELNHINVKLLVREPAQVDLDPVVPIFHNWIQNQMSDERLLDVADYRHVAAGPGVILIGLEADYSLDQADHRLGLRYNRKAVLDGSNQDRLNQAASAALTAFARLEDEPGLKGKLRFNGHDVEISINDRLLAPNSEETRKELSPDFEFFASRLFGGAEYSLSYNNDHRRLFTGFLRASRPLTVTTLLENLLSASPLAGFTPN
ncbi:MAG TPA: hypothetical protein VHA33_28510 [Candidatus Angelobacter sp.]|jgi:hypothetical protein|nr:hypothetical protein [Candidatus Angelobacter sp.]